MATSIREFRGEYQWLSNFVEVPIELDSVLYPSVEHAYQAAKTLIRKERLRFLNCSAAEAKKKGKTVTLRSDWETIRLSLMEKLCRQKYQQEPFRTKLLETGDCLIEENNYWNDTFWGICRGTGMNHLGKIIMKIRKELTEKDFRDKNWIAVIGSREPTETQEIAIIQKIEELDPQSECVISGCAYGIDALALQTASNLGIVTIGIVPWPKYNLEIQDYCTHIICLDSLRKDVRQEAYASVQQHHPNAAKLSQGAIKLHARNYGIVRWAEQVIAAPSNKPGGGGTGQGIRLAKALKIPVIIV